MWRLDAAGAGELQDLVSSLPPGGGETQPPSLGYRGFRVRFAGGETLVAYAGVVASAGVRRVDAEHRVELWLLASAGERIEETVRRAVAQAIAV